MPTIMKFSWGRGHSWALSNSMADGHWDWSRCAQLPLHSVRCERIVAGVELSAHCERIFQMKSSSDYYLAAALQVHLSNQVNYLTGGRKLDFCKSIIACSVYRIHRRPRDLRETIVGQNDICYTVGWVGLGWGLGKHSGKRCENPEKFKSNHAGILWVWICPYSFSLHPNY